MKITSIQKALCSGMLLTMMVTGAYARHLTPEQALSRTHNETGMKRISGSAHYDLVHSVKADGEDFVYIFNNDKHGFIIVSADDRMPAILGYSDNGGFDLENASPSLKWWLNQYAEEAASSLSNAYAEILKDTRTESSTGDRNEIPALITTKWGQDNPFNLDCPEIGVQKCVTGCVATAMAQVIKYHNYPDSGNDVHSYNWNGTPLEFDYGNTSFKFEDMLDIYSGSESTEANEAVAKLMFACGVAVNMAYGLEESGASDNYIPYALRQYFKYDNAIRMLKREFFDYNEWEELIYSEINQKRPVILGGQAREGGHQFICDGYDGNGYFHINWGWTGMGDGYFLLNALNPEYQGVGGYEGGYNSNQTVVCGIQPATGDSKIWYPIYSTGNLTVNSIDNNMVSLELKSGSLFNYSPEPVDVEILLCAISTDGTEYISEPSSFTMSDDPTLRTTYPFAGAQGLNIFGFSKFVPFNLPKDLPAGEYRCNIVIKTPEGNIQKIYFPCTCTSYFNLSVSSSGKISYTQGSPEVKAEIKVVRFEPEAPVIQGEPATFDITIENIGNIEYSGQIEYRIFNDGQMVNDKKMVISFNSIQPGEKPTFIYTTTLRYEPGTYGFIFYDQYGQQISEPFSITIGESGVETLFDDSKSVDIYSAGGILIKKNTDLNSFKNLPKGLYIIRSNGKSSTVLK